MAKTPKKNKKELDAKALFMTGQFEQQQIAKIVGTTPQTMSRWVTTGKWDVILESITTSKEKRIAKYQKYLADIDARIEGRLEGEQIPTNAEIDQINKLETTIKKLQDKASLGEIVLYTRNLLDFAKASNLELAQDLSGVCDAYIKSLI